MKLSFGAKRFRSGDNASGEREGAVGWNSFIATGRPRKLEARPLDVQRLDAALAGLRRQL
jgi:hypothetical protein